MWEILFERQKFGGGGDNGGVGSLVEVQQGGGESVLLYTEVSIL